MTDKTSSSRRLWSVGLLASATAAFTIIPFAAQGTPHRDYASCDVDGHINNASVAYDLTSTKHIWTTIYGKISGSGTGGQSNYYTSIYDGETRAWYWASGDTWGQNEQYTKIIPDVQTLRAHYERVRMRTVFDEFGPDDECTVKWDY